MPINGISDHWKEGWRRATSCPYILLKVRGDVAWRDVAGISAYTMGFEVTCA